MSIAGVQVTVLASCIFLSILLHNAARVHGQCNNYDVRLTNRDSTNSNGVVELCYETRWHRLCDNDIRRRIRNALCSQLGFSGEGRVLSGDAPSGGPMFIELDFSCVVNDSPDIRMCSPEATRGVCSSNQPVMLECNNDVMRFLATEYYMATRVQTFSSMTQGNFMLMGDGIPIEDDIAAEITMANNGVIVFGPPLPNGITPMLPVMNAAVRLLAPFWTASVSGGDIGMRIEVYQVLNERTDFQYLDITSRFISERTSSNFNASTLILFEWDSVEISGMDFRYQAIVVTNGTDTYAIYTYRCEDELPSNAPAEIGFSTPTGSMRFRYSNLERTAYISCLNDETANFYNLVYKLPTDPQNSSGQANSTGPPPAGSGGSCVMAGFASQSCCEVLTDPTRRCRTGNCYCDGLCFERGDCCSDIYSVMNVRSCIPSCDEGTTDLISGTSANRGYLTICRNGIRQFVCTKDWDDIDAVHVCSQLGFLDGTNDDQRPSLDSGRMYSAAINRVNCSGVETSLGQCSHINVSGDACTTQQFAAIRCSGTAECTNGAVRIGDLMGNAVEVCSSGRWQTVCADESWGRNEASVVCTQLNMSGTAFASTVPRNQAMVGIEMIRCLAGVRNISECEVNENTDSEVQCSVIAAVQCGGTPSSIPPTNVPVELIAGVVGAVVGLLVLILLFIAVVAPWILIVKYKRRRSLDTFVLEELAKHRPHTDSSEFLGNDYVRSKLFQGKGQNVTIKPEYMDLLTSKLIILEKQLRLLDSIGQGEFGVVYKAHLFGRAQNDDMQTVAVKTLKGFYGDDEIDELIKESLQMKQMNHPNVMGLLGVCLDAGPAPYIVLPFMSNGSLLSYLKNHRKTLLLTSEADEEQVTKTETKLLSMCLQICKGMEYLASLKFVHRDLAARNCMIDESGIIKVGDFGLSKSTYEKMYFRQDKSVSIKLPIKWMAIESIDDALFSEKSDVWSFGVTCWEIFNGGKVPFGGLAPLSIPKFLRDGERMEKPDNAACSDKTYDMVMKPCWIAKPDDRPTFSMLQSEISSALSIMAGYMEFSEFVSVDDQVED